MPSTPVLIVMLALGAGVLDIVLAHFRGNEGTISWAMLNAQSQSHILAGLCSYAFAGLMVHCFWPSEGVAPHPFGILWRALLFLAPVFYALELIARSTPDADGIIQVVPGKLPILAVMCCGALLGAIAAKLLVPQHLPPRPPPRLVDALRAERLPDWSK